MGEREVPFEQDIEASGALAEGEHVVPMTVRDADGNLLATLGDVVVNVTRDERGWVWAARIPGLVDPDLAEHLSAGRFSFKIPDDPPRLRWADGLGHQVDLDLPPDPAAGPGQADA